MVAINSTDDGDDDDGHKYDDTERGRKVEEKDEE